MAEESFKRKLTAILSADVEGYSRLMGEDEDATIRTLTAYRELMSTLIQKHRGRVVDSPGDNLLAEFLSVVDAVRCAVEIQEELRVRNAELPENRRMEFRIGVNLGDVVEEGERIYGDGVNITARVEGLAEAGGICISGTVYDSIKNKLSLSYESLGEHTVKNIKEPVRVYRMCIGPEAAAPVVSEKKARLRHWHKAALTAVAALVVVAGAWAIWNFYFRPPPLEPASIEKMAFPLPKTPSIAVLPFDNLSGDPEQDYIADNISENIITALSSLHNIFAVARNSSFTYKGKPVKVQKVSEDLGVRYVLEGSVLMSEERIRITAQLIDALTGGHIWSDRYDRDFNDFFNLLDEITLAIITELKVELTEGEQARIRTTDNLDAWRYASKAGEYFLTFSKEGMIKSRELYKKALEKDPEFSGAVTALAWTHFNDARFGYTKSRRESFKRAVELANKSLAMDENQPLVHDLLAYLYLIRKQYDKAIEEGRKSIALGPNRAVGHNLFCEVLYRTGNFEEAVPMCEKAIRFQPHTPLFYLGNLMSAYYWVGRYEASLAVAERLIEQGRKTGFKMGERWGYWGSARAKVKLGRESEALKDFAKFLEIATGWTWDLDRRNTLYKPEIIEQEHQDMRILRIPGHPSSQ
jgi:adenylate cyclase